jgi:hypothetical protein
MGVKENLIAARALIDMPEKWGKGSRGLRGTRECAMTACGALKLKSHEFDGVRLALTAALPHGSDLTAPAVVRFNDDPSTTHTDIMALFDRAIASA